MLDFLSEFLQKNNIDTFAPIPLSACRIVRPYLLDRIACTDGTVILLAVPYYTRACEDRHRNLSAYAVSKDYHIFFSILFDTLLPILRERFPTHRFAGFADHSPIDEIDAAAKAGLGMIGDNHMLITSKYSSYVFLGEIITDAISETTPCEPRHCEGCGACRQACPMTKGGICLSALTQKKGELSSAEKTMLSAHDTVWGCDRCQEVCPHTMRARQSETIYSPIPFFNADTLPHLSLTTLNAMSDEEFRQRAYAWRGRAVIERNLTLKEKGTTPC